jgi:hypothetical protein
VRRALLAASCALANDDDIPLTHAMTFVEMWLRAVLEQPLLSGYVSVCALTRRLLNAARRYDMVCVGAVCVIAMRVRSAPAQSLLARCFARWTRVMCVARPDDVIVDDDDDDVAITDDVGDEFDERVMLSDERLTRALDVRSGAPLLCTLLVSCRDCMSAMMTSLSTAQSQCTASRVIERARLSACVHERRSGALCHAAQSHAAATAHRGCDMCARSCAVVCALIVRRLQICAVRVLLASQRCSCDTATRWCVMRVG